MLYEGIVTQKCAPKQIEKQSEKIEMKEKLATLNRKYVFSVFLKVFFLNTVTSLDILKNFMSFFHSSNY